MTPNESSSQSVLAANIFADVCLVKNDDRHWVRVSAVGCRLGSDSEAEGNVVHVVHNDALVLLGVFRDPTKSGLHDVIAVQELLLSGCLHPHLKLGVGCQEVEGCDVQPKLLRLCELSKARSETDEMLSRNVAGLLQYLFTNVINSIFLKTKAICTIRPINKQFHIFTDVF